MGQSTQKKTNQLLDTQRGDIQKDYTQPINTARDRSAESYNSSRGMIPGLSDRYSNLADNGGFDAGEFDKYMGDAGGGGYGGGDLGVDESKFGDAIKGYQDMASGGGVDVQGLVSRAESAIPAFYKNLQDEMTNRRRINPYAPTFDAEQAKMARQAGQQTVEAGTNARLDAGEVVNRNKQFGIQGLGNLQQAIQEMQQRGKITGAQLSDSAAGRRSNAQLALIQARNQGKLAGLGGLENLYQVGNDNALQYGNQQLSGVGGKTGGIGNNIGSRQNTTPWWQTALQAAGGGFAGAMGGGFGGSIRPRKSGGHATSEGIA
jgi:hypothetical protein